MLSQFLKFYGSRFVSAFFVILSGLFIVGGVSGAAKNTVADFDGDGKSDISVFRPSNGYWYYLKSSGGFSSVQWGISTDTPVPGDYDGDGKTDVAVHRDGTPARDETAPNIWYILRSSDNTFNARQWGITGSRSQYQYTIPTPGDYDGDGKTDLAFYQRADYTGGPSRLAILQSSTNLSDYKTVGIDGNRKAPADYDGDGKIDLTDYQNGVWTILQTSNATTRTEFFGISTDKLVPADYDGDGRADLAVWRPSNGTWYISGNSGGFRAVQFGLPEDKPTPADYDGDGKTDIAVFRPSSGVWYLLQSRDGFRAEQFGLSGDIPLPNVFVR